MMRINTEQTKRERLEKVVGYILVFAGMFIILIVGSFFGFTADWPWFVGLPMVLVGLLVAKSTALIEFVAGFR